MTTTPEVNLETMSAEEVDELLNQLDYHKAQVERIETALKQNPTGTTETGTWRINLAAGSRFDAAAFERDNPEEEHPELYITTSKVDVKKLTSETKQAYSKPTAPRLTIKHLTK